MLENFDVYNTLLHGNQVLQLERKFLKVKFSCLLQETAIDHLCQS